MTAIEPINPADLEGVKNDSELDPDEIAERLRPDNVVEIEFGDKKLRIERHVYEEACYEAQQITPAQRQRALLSLERVLRRNMPRVGPALSAKKNNETAMDLVLWHALKELMS